MFVAFFDESGYQTNWENCIAEQPLYVLSIVCFPGEKLAAAYDSIRNMVRQAGAGTAVNGTLGKGYEIKATDITRGTGFWKDNVEARNAVREGYLSTPTEFGGTAFVVVVDKQAHKDRYPNPDNPYMLSLKYGLERLEWFLRRHEDHAVCIYDQNKRIEDDLNTETAELLARGSRIVYDSLFYRDEVLYNHELNHVLELAHGDSKNSLGLQVSDFFATLTYQYFKRGRPANCGWWETLKAQLDRKEGNPYGQLEGCGLKLFPPEAF